MLRINALLAERQRIIEKTGAPPNEARMHPSMRYEFLRNLNESNVRAVFKLNERYPPDVLLGAAVVEDPNLPPNVVQFRDGSDKVLATVEVCPIVSAKTPR